jgi:hypothetical protein
VDGWTEGGIDGRTDGWMGGHDEINRWYSNLLFKMHLKTGPEKNKKC